MEKILKRIGQLFVMSFEGETPPERFLRFLASEQIGGIILFEANCLSHARARDNIRLINRRITNVPPLIAIDQEGGPGCRLKGVPVEYAAAADYAARNDLEGFTEDYARAVVLMSTLGINLNLAPVADIALNDDNQCLSGRCYGSDPQSVSRFVRASVRVAKSHRMLSCLKHFPGLGEAKIDPHKAIATVDYDRVLWEQREMVPFLAGTEAGADLIMTTHLLADKIDNRIATASKTICSEMIRRDLDFDGPIITDDLTGMKGVDSLGSYGERAVAAFMAGHDLLLFCNSYEAGMEAYEYFRNAVESGDIPKEQVQESLDRIAGVKLKLRRSVVV